MEFGLSEEQKLLQDSVTRFLTDKVGLERVRRYAGDATDRGDDIWRGLTELGIPGLMVPETQGGAGLELMDAAVVAECLGYGVAPGPFLATAVMAPLALCLARRREDVLGAISAGDARVGLAFGEALGARNDAGIRYTGNRVSGKSIFVLEHDADYVLLATGDRKILLVKGDAKGLSKRPLATVERTRRTGELVFDTTEADLISDDSSLFERVVDAGRVALAADTLGAAQYMLDKAVSYSLQREQFNRVIGSFQAVKHMCAEMVAHLEPCRALVWYASHAQDHIAEEARLVACHAKAHLSEVGKMVSKTATEVHGGMGFTDLVGLHYWFKRIGFNRQILGSPEMLREEAARVQGLVS